MRMQLVNWKEAILQANGMSGTEFAGKGDEVKGRKLKRNSFTLIEIMVVITVIAIMMAIAIPNFVKYRNRARAGACGANLIQIARAYESYMMENNVEISSDTGVTAAELSGRLVGSTNYLKEWPTCGSAGTYSLTVFNTGVPLAYCSVPGHL